jgi:gamma-glutamyltranspeptidase/glutathione hydrolase
VLNEGIVTHPHVPVAHWADGPVGMADGAQSPERKYRQLSPIVVRPLPLQRAAWRRGPGLVWRRTTKPTILHAMLRIDRWARWGLLTIAVCALSTAAPRVMAQALEDDAGFATEDRAPSVATRHMVAASMPMAAEAGLAILRKGGSAIDAAIAVQAMLTLTEPQSSGFGGGAFIVFFDKATGQITTYDGREMAPSAAGEDYFLGMDGKLLPNDARTTGGRSVGVPGSLRALEAAHKAHGKLAWRELFTDAIDRAENGFPVSARMHASIRGDRHLAQFEAARAYFYEDDGAPLAAGRVLRNPALASTLRAIAIGGADALYKGPIGDDIARAVQSSPNPGKMTATDVANYVAKERPAVCGLYRVYRVCGMGPPSSGAIGTLATLKVLEPFDLARMAPLGVDSVHLLAEAGKLAHVDRIRYVGDADFNEVPTAALTAPEYLALRSKLIDPKRDTGPAEPGDPVHKRADAAMPVFADDEAPGTAHFSIVDDNGNVLAMTTSVGYAFGSRLFVRGLILNDHMSDFTGVPVQDGVKNVNRIEPGKRPRSSMSPTLVFDDHGAFVASAGSPGGYFIVGFVAEALVGMLDWGMDPQRAAGLPHVINLNGDTRVERGTPLEGLADNLRARGHTVRIGPINSGIQAIMARDGKLLGGADPRREGVAIGD